MYRSFFCWSGLWLWKEFDDFLTGTGRLGYILGLWVSGGWLGWGGLGDGEGWGCGLSVGSLLITRRVCGAPTVGLCSV